MNADSQPRVTDLEALVRSLPRTTREKFDRIFHLGVTTGQLVPPDTMEGWLVRQFGSLEPVRWQRIVKITNRVTLEGTLFNALRSRRPLQAPCQPPSTEEGLPAQDDCSFCSPRACTPADFFGRIQGRHCLTASNVAKYDGWHSVIVFDEHQPLRFTADQVADYLETAQQWAQRAHQADPSACYPLFLWNCLWRSGASILHGHAQMVLSCDMHYAKVEHWRQAALRYRQAYRADYFADLIAVSRALHLAVDHRTAAILPSLTPFKEKETLIIAPEMGDDLKSAIYHLLTTFVYRLGVQSFNLALYHPPLTDTAEDWQGFPFVARVLDRGLVQNATSDIGAMEIFAQSVVSSDPFQIAQALRLQPSEMLP
jgi:galactose-1-phosphate uridylyltransferase